MIVNRAGEGSFAGIPTFAKLPLVLDPAELAGVDVAILGAPMDETVSNRPGSRYGPRAIRQADEASGLPPSRPHMLLGVDPFAVLNVVDYGDAETIPGDTARSHDAIRQRVAEICAAGRDPGRARRRPLDRRPEHDRRRRRTTGPAASASSTSTRTRTRPSTSPASCARTARRCASSSTAARSRATASCRSGCAASGRSRPSSRGCARSGSAGGRPTSSTSAASTSASTR